MTYYYALGTIPPKRHTQFRQSDGSLYHEELIGQQGFSGPRSLLYHLRPPTQIQQILNEEKVQLNYVKDVPLKHRHLRSTAVSRRGDPISAQVPLLGNDDVCLSVCCPTEPMNYWFKWAMGDLVIFIHEGQGVVESQFGLLSYQVGDYLVIPSGVLWRMLPDQQKDQRMLFLEVQGHVSPPKRYVNPVGQFSEQSPYCERDIHPPERLDPHDESGDFDVKVKTQGQITQYRYAYHPCDVVGWDGYLWPYRFNIQDFEPITGRIHQPPTVHQTFEGSNFVVCSFVPRLFDYHPNAIPAPYNHSNVDSDEVLYYVEGQFMSRRNIESGSISLHPRGIPHGPHPGAVEASIGKGETHELAIMLDTFRPLFLTPEALGIEDSHYLYSWCKARASGTTINKREASASLGGEKSDSLIQLQGGQ